MKHPKILVLFVIVIIGLFFQIADDNQSWFYILRKSFNSSDISLINTIFDIWLFLFPVGLLTSFYFFLTESYRKSQIFIMVSLIGICSIHTFFVYEDISFFRPVYWFYIYPVLMGILAYFVFSMNNPFPGMKFPIRRVLISIGIFSLVIYLSYSLYVYYNTGIHMFSKFSVNKHCDVCLGNTEASITSLEGKYSGTILNFNITNTGSDTTKIHIYSPTDSRSFKIVPVKSPYAILNLFYKEESIELDVDQPFNFKKPIVIPPNESTSFSLHFKELDSYISSVKRFSVISEDVELNRKLITFENIQL